MKYKILLVDISTYFVKISEEHEKILRKRWKIQSYIWEKRTNHKLIRPSLTYSRGMLIIGASLEKKGHLVKYLNYSDPIDNAKIYSLAKEANIICINVLTPTYYIVVNVCDDLKRINKKLQIIIGGPHVNALPIDSLKNCMNADFALIGNAEHTLPEFLNSKMNPESVYGVIYRFDNKIFKSKIKGINKEDNFYPAYHLLNRPLNQYSHNILTTHGCPFRCNFCFDRKTMDQGYQEVGINQVLEELKFLSKNLQPGTLIHFSDSNFNYNFERTYELSERIRLSNLNLLFSIDTRLDLISKEHVTFLSNAGVIYFRLGFESNNLKSLSLTNKSININDAANISNLIREVSPNLAILAYFITGLPGTTFQSMKADASYINNLIMNKHVDIIGNKIFVPYPGTPYFEESTKYSIKILTLDWSKYDRNSIPVFDLNSIYSQDIYKGFLHQEKVLTNAYLKVINKPFDELNLNNLALDYAFNSYTK